MRIVFSGGGTGGHIFPATAVADEVKKRFPQAEILFIGAKGKMEMEKIPKAGYPIKGLWISGFQRQLTLRNVLFPVKVLYSLISSYFILRRFKPDAVAGFGGYASGAALYMATMMRIPTLIQEQNSYPGITNKVLANRVAKICVADANMSRFFPNDKMIHTGNPVRKPLLTKANKHESVLHFGLDPNLKTVFIAGGSLGARTLNQAMRDNHAAIAENKGIQYLWQCGSLYIDEYQLTTTAKLSNVKIVAFIDGMEKAYSAADLVVCRAGALTVSELCVQAKASIFVPSPNVAEDHQTKNAMALVDREAALLLSDVECLDQLTNTIESTLRNEELLKKLESNIAKMAMPNAVENICDELLNLIHD